MQLPIYHIDTFTAQPFHGNPAAVCPLETWLPDAVMQAIAHENNLSETAFFIPDGEKFHIRWFTPVTEVDLCGHATMAAAFVIFNHLHNDRQQILFHSASGLLTVSHQPPMLIMDFPVQPPHPCPIPPVLEQALGAKPLACLQAKDYIALFENEAQIAALQPEMKLLQTLDLRGVIVTAAGRDCDFVSRFFAPKLGINEDPVTGSTHTQLAPYWSGQLQRSRLRARQCSPRGGEIYCELRADRLLISGEAVQYMQGTIALE